MGPRILSETLRSDDTPRFSGNGLFRITHSRTHTGTSIIIAIRVCAPLSLRMFISVASRIPPRRLCLTLLLKFVH